jgi:hypothetical protein
MKNLVSQILLLFLLISGSNFLVELFTEGNINSFLEKPIRFFVSTLLISIIGGYINYRVLKTMPKE